MQPSDTTEFFNYIERTSRPDVQAKRRLLARPLIEAKYSSINLLVRAIDGNTRDRVWVSQALKDGAIVRGPEGELQLPEASAEEPELGEGLEYGSLDWLLEQLLACGAHVSVLFMRENIAHAWNRAAGARACGKVWKLDKASDTYCWANKETK